MQVKKLFTLLAFLGIAASASAQEVTFTANGGTSWGTGVNGPDKLFDNTSQKWGSNITGAWFSFMASEPIILTGYAIRMGSDSKVRNTGRSPKSWTISGSNDNISWNLIKSENDNTTMHEPTANNSEKTYYFEIVNNFSPYKYYKFEFTEVQGDSETQDQPEDQIQISELIPSYRRFTNSLVGVAGGDWWHDSDPWENMFDGDLTTRWCCGDNDSRNYLIFDAGSSIELTSYMLVTGTDTQTYSDRNPKGWKICGSNDDSPTKDGNWTPIVNISGNNDLKAKNNIPYVFDVSYGQDDPLSAAQSFRYYKFEVVGTDVNNDMFQLNEIALNPKTVEAHTCTTSTYTYSFAGGNTAQQVNLCNVCNKAITTQYTGFTLKDGKPFIALVNGWGGGAAFTYTRTVSSSMGTVCLPYQLKNIDSKDDATYYTLAFYNSDSDVLVFDQVTGFLEQKTPAIYVLTNSEGTSLNLNSSDAAFSVTDNDNVVKADRKEDGWSMVGTMKSGTASEDNNSIYYLKGGSFKRCYEGGSISFKPYRAYIVGPSGGVGSPVKAFAIADDMEDAINSLTPTLTEGEVVLYDLSGRKVNDIRHGEIYIMNGRKVMFNK